MYKIVLYVLGALVLIAILLSFLGILSYSPIAILLSVFFITTVSLITNIIFAWKFKVPANVESVYITALILVLLITPAHSAQDLSFFIMASFSSVLAISSKYILAIKKKHIFNPVAISIVLTAIIINQPAQWWVGTLSMLPFVLIGGFLIVRKIRRFDMIISFLVVAILAIVIPTATGFSSSFIKIWRISAYTPLFFFAAIMLTEPLTTPPTKWLRILYGGFVGLLFSPFAHIGAIYSTPELALVIGNIFSYIVSPKEKLILKLKEIQKVAHNTYNFVFKSNRSIHFKPGQYLEWTISDKNVDSRGNRRYFTIVSSPTEKDITMGIKFYPKPSSFKKGLINLELDDIIIASQRAGDFVLPKNKNKKIVFVAGGIGVTPFISMLKYLIDKKEKRDIIIFYSNKRLNDIAYTDIFDEAYNELGIKTFYVLTDLESLPKKWLGERGFINVDLIIKKVPDYKERIFYLSGPHSMVVAFKDILKQINIKKHNIIKDYFPGLT